MPTASIETQQIFNGIVQFISYMVLAVFAENVVLARALGVTRLIKLVPDHRAQVWDFGLPLLFVMVLSVFFHGCAIIFPIGCRSRRCAPSST